MDFCLWMIGVTTLGLATKLYSLFFLAIILGIVAIIGHPFIIFASFNPFLQTSSLLLLASTVITFLTAWLIRRQAPDLYKSKTS